MGRELRGIKGRDAIKAFLRAGGMERPGTGDHINIKMPNGMIITIPDGGELKIGLLKSAIHKAGLTEEQFLDLPRCCIKMWLNQLYAPIKRLFLPF